MRPIAFGLLVVLLVSALGEAAKCPTKAVGQSCSQSIECASRYCRGGACTTRDKVSDEAGFPDQCKKPCPPGETCTYQQVQCFMYPCPAQRDCVSPSVC